MKEYYRLDDNALRTWMIQFRDTATSLASSLGLSASDITAIDQATGGFGSALDVQETARVNARAATASKNLVRDNSLKTIAKYANAFRANTAISDDSLILLGLPPHEGYPQPPLAAPQNLKVSVSASGTNSLRWKRNGNDEATIFVVEARNSTSAPWETVGGGTRATFKHTDQTPGQTMYYRVLATRDGQTSEPSNVAVAYGQGESGGVTLEIAA